MSQPAGHASLGAAIAPVNPRDAIAQALAALLAAGETWPPSTPQRFRNLLLDACGSDHRALVELLLRVGRHGVAEALRRLGPVAPVAWPSHRTRLVSLACGELFIGAEIAAWAVDAWAVALRVIPATTADTLRREYAERERRAEAERQRLEAQAALLARTPGAMALGTGGMSGSGATRGAAAATAGYAGPSGAVGGIGRPLTGAGGLLANPRWGGTAATVLAQPSWAGGAGAGRLGAWRRNRGGSPRWRVSATPIPPPNMKRFFALFAVVSVCLFGVVTLMRRLTPSFTVPVPLIELPQVAAEPLAERPAAGARPAPAPAPATADTAAVREPPPTGTRDADRVVVGRIPRALAESLAVGRVSRPDAGRADAGPADAGRIATPPAAFGVDLVATGIGGLYDVEHRVLSVFGDGLCDPVAETLARRQTRSIEEIAHIPGEAIFALVTRPGVVGTIARDGVFTTQVHRTTHDNVRLVFRMSGRFTPEGFVARTTTETDAVLRYRERQRCLIQADLIGTRRR